VKGIAEAALLGAFLAAVLLIIWIALTIYAR